MEQTQPQSIADLRPKMQLQGTVKETQMYGAVVDIGLERNGVVHISQLAPKRVNRVTDVVHPGDSVNVWVTQVDPEQGRIALTMVKPPDVDWRELAENQIHTGKVTRMEPYGVFVDIGAERPGLLHVREMSEGYVRHPSELVKIGDEVQVRILKLDRRKHRIDLTMNGIDEEQAMQDTDDEEETEPAQTAMEIALQHAQSHPSQRRAQKQRHKRQPTPGMSEREQILARTLEKHAQ